MQFSAFPGPELITKCSQNNEIFVFLIFYYNIIGLQFVFLS